MACDGLPDACLHLRHHHQLDEPLVARRIIDPRRSTFLHEPAEIEMS